MAAIVVFLYFLVFRMCCMRFLYCTINRARQPVQQEIEVVRR